MTRSAADIWRTRRISQRSGLKKRESPTVLPTTLSFRTAMKRSVIISVTERDLINFVYHGIDFLLQIRYDNVYANVTN